MGFRSRGTLVVFSDRRLEMAGLSLRIPPLREWLDLIMVHISDFSETDER